MSILVVDDETDIRTLFEQKFRKEIREKIFTFEFAQFGNKENRDRADDFLTKPVDFNNLKEKLHE